MRKFFVLSLLLVASHFATAADTLPQVAAPPAASNTFQPSGQPQPLPGDFGPPGAAQAQITAQAQQTALVQQQAQLWAAQQAALQKPNIGSKASNPSAILSALMNMFSGPGKTSAAQVPEPYLPNGQINPEFESYVRGGGQLPSNDYEYSDHFKPNYNRPEVKITPSEMCKYPVANAKKNFAGHNCNERTNDRMTCMVCNIFYEAGVEPQEGQIAVGQSSLRRLFSSYANPGEGLCKVVYRITTSRRSGAKVAQYSWVLENKNHTLPAGRALDRVVDSALKSFCAGPSEFTNYFAPSIVNPSWNKTGECATGKRAHYGGPTGGHIFCAINGRINRSVAEVMASEGISLSRTTADSDAEISR